MKDNPLKKVGTLGQSIWLDYIRHDLITLDDYRDHGKPKDRIEQEVVKV